MIGARKYASLFNIGQYGRLFLVPGAHARGTTFEIWILPKGYIISKDDKRIPENSVQVYGVISGQPGWDEVYGWLHHGKWEDDFYTLVEQRKKEIANREEQAKKEELTRKEKETIRIAKLLQDY